MRVFCFITVHVVLAVAGYPKDHRPLGGHASCNAKRGLYRRHTAEAFVGKETVVAHRKPVSGEGKEPKEEGKIRLSYIVSLQQEDDGEDESDKGGNDGYHGHISLKTGFRAGNLGLLGSRTGCRCAH